LSDPRRVGGRPPARLGALNAGASPGGGLRPSRAWSVGAARVAGGDARATRGMVGGGGPVRPDPAAFGEGRPSIVPVYASVRALYGGRLPTARRPAGHRSRGVRPAGDWVHSRPAATWTGVRGSTICKQGKLLLVVQVENPPRSIELRWVGKG